jgi:formate hydrogenlyase subunit 3/multisubunit Na+/H+ antiporter MnhD subunit
MTIIKLVIRLLINIVIAIPTTLVAWNVLYHGNYEYSLGLASITGNWDIKIDLLSAYFILIINMVLIASSTYAVFYLKDNQDKLALNIKLISSLILHLSMLLVCVVQEFIPFLISWELMTLASFMMVAFQFEKHHTLKSAVYYLVQMHIGVLFLILAMSIVSIQTGLSNWEGLGNYFFTHNSNFMVFLLFFIGFGFKVGFVPLHTWMPQTYKVAPAHTAGLMAGVLKKMGLFGILKILLFVQASRLEIGIFILSISLFSALYGVINAIMQKDIKIFFSYSSIENMGIIGIGIGMGMIGFGVHDLALAYFGFSAALLQILNHAIFKTALFFVNGNIFQQTQSRNINELGGLAKKMPASSVLFLLLSLAVCGLPPFNGFVAEYLIFAGLIEGMNATFVTTEVFLLICLISLSIIGGLAVFAYAKVFGLVFLGNARTVKVQAAKDVSWWMQSPIIALLLLALSIGLFPDMYLDRISLIVDEFVPHYSHTSVNAYSNIHEIGHASIWFMSMALVLILIRKWTLKNKPIDTQPTWGCGYEVKSARLQYTSESWADYFVKFGRAWAIIGNTFKPFDPNDIFPKNQSVEIIHKDKVEQGLVKPIARTVKFALKKLAVVQTGQTQYYILYAFIFLLLLSIMTLFKLI